MNDSKKKKKERLFSIARINKYYLLPFLAPVICCSANFFIHFVQKKNEDMELNFVSLLLIDFTFLFGGALFFVTAIRNKTEETRDNAIVYRTDSIGGVRYIYNDGRPTNSKKIIFLLILCSLLICLSSLGNLLSSSRSRLHSGCRCSGSDTSHS